MYNVYMLSLISDFIKSILPAKKKTNSTGWISFNAPCCPHNGETADTRGRGGLTTNTDGSVSYHCFNCGFKASYQPGRHLTFKFRKLLSWLGAGEQDIKRLVIEAIRIRELVNPEEITVKPEEKIEFKVRTLPADATTLDELQTFFVLVDGDYDKLPPLSFEKARYVIDRKIDLNTYQFYISDAKEHSLDRRVIIPCYWQHKLIGYTARAVVNGVTPKYHNNYESDYVFNTDMQVHDNAFVLAMEGPFDAMAVDGVAVLGNHISEQQADIIDSLGKEVIVVPDFDMGIDEKTGKFKWTGEALIEQAIELGWSVSFPVWLETCKDVSSAVEKYGKLFVIKCILDAKETSRLKIELMRKKLHN